MSEPTNEAHGQGRRERPGYLYRSAPLTEAELRDLLVRQVFPEQQVYAFGANTVELQPIRPYPSAADVQFHGERGKFDFGHVFSPRAEVRWKYDGANYDALVLTEDETLMDELHGSQPLLGTYIARQANRETELLLYTSEDVRQRGMRRRLGYWEYRGSNQAVQFTRYTAVREEPDR